MSKRRGGTKAVESPQAEEQAKRETGILSVQYNTIREIPPSPEEPVEEPADGASGDWKEIPVPDYLRVDVCLTFLCISPHFLAKFAYALRSNMQCLALQMQANMLYTPIFTLINSKSLLDADTL